MTPLNSVSIGGALPAGLAHADGTIFDWTLVDGVSTAATDLGITQGAHLLVIGISSLAGMSVDSVLALRFGPTDPGAASLATDLRLTEGNLIYPGHGYTAFVVSPASRFVRGISNLLGGLHARAWLVAL